MRTAKTLCTALVALTFWSADDARATPVGERAVAIQPAAWLNGQGDVSWEGLQGRLLLVERWATW
jgi:hypothetical protein